ncbi:predicted protein [Scheffersomyces stipitis CBS 6054]|uniref:Antiviral helicase SKI2 n=1 Tax=Scheffersomyces stipitis (strain ATCC 58785 / CBS 6054 / NBRC 10063 / NRRL Y-11545) TaxID=322104 RepID=A3LZ34_PICST|nr:predicted protein [Scheffersomyces stipitis CBS 6054]ABN68267.2 predicted protein [Scheffersomyces stipitis CBS 6054]
MSVDSGAEDDALRSILDPHTRTNFREDFGEDFAAQDQELLNSYVAPSDHVTWEIQRSVQTVPQVDKQKVHRLLLKSPERMRRTSYRLKRNILFGQVTGYKEELRQADIDNAKAENSMSVNRKYTTKLEALRGRSSYLPFNPGGIIGDLKEVKPIVKTKRSHRDQYGLLDRPPDLSRGLKLDESQQNQQIESLAESIDSLKMLNEVNDLDDEGTKQSSQEQPSSQVFPVPFVAAEIEGIVVPDFVAINAASKAKRKQKSWAHVVDLDHTIDNFHELIPNMARTWPFELDTFQKEAVYHLEKGDSVFVAAHTSAGKTVVAEYAIAMASRNLTRTIYTSPIKALSNQKFRDFKETFKDTDVGLITGDVQINPGANCLIMTTEVLRSMLYRGADIIRDVEFVIFDEVHYVNDIDRGVVWEEVIIMLPDHIKYILLSATVPNTFEFANWVGRTKEKDIYVISTPKRPVPLEIFISAKDNMFKVVDSHRVFSEDEFKKHKEHLENSKKKPGLPKASMGSGTRGGPGGSARGGNRGGRGGQSANRGRGNLVTRAGGRFFAQDGPNKGTWLNLVQYLKKSNLLPCVAFVFSKKKCEEYADSLTSVDLCTAREKSEIHMFIDKSLFRLKKEDRELPQILKIREMLSRGIAVHHGGLLPIVKECIEILFAKTLVKVLFATETFAMGLNLPTRTVVFSSLRKNDGRSFRNLLPGEFTQMSGRAGRRGIDATGTVIVMAYNDPLSPVDFKEITLGTPTKLQSQFRLTYNMILNLLRIEALPVEEMIKHSFSENSTQVLLPENQKKVDKLLLQSHSLKLTPCEECDLEGIQETYDLMKSYEVLYGQLTALIHEVSASKLQILKSGRLVFFRDNNKVVRMGAIVKSDNSTDSVSIITFDHGKPFEEDSAMFKLPFVPIYEYRLMNFKKIIFNGNLRVESVPYESICFICGYAIMANIFQVLQNEEKAVSEFKEQINSILEFQNEIEEVSFGLMNKLSLYESLAGKRNIYEQLCKTTSWECSNFKSHYVEIHEKNKLEVEIASLQSMISDENLELLPDYAQRLQVLETMGFIDEQQNVVLKGRVACEINSGWELVVTELVLDNFLGDFEPEEIVALLSCFVYEGRTNEEEPPLINGRLERGKTRILELTEKLLDVYGEHQVSLTSEEEEFLDRKRFALTNVVFEWARGLSFNEVMQISPEAEGTIVRVITRLDEVCREVRNAALIVGDSTLSQKMSVAQEKIKRDIVFCASLYL